MEKPCYATPYPSRIPILVNKNYLYSTPISSKVVKSQVHYNSIPCRIPQLIRRLSPSPDQAASHKRLPDMEIELQNYIDSESTKSYNDEGKKSLAGNVSDLKAKSISGIVSKVISKCIDNNLFIDSHDTKQNHYFHTPSLDRRSKVRFQNAHSFWKDIEIRDRL
ncbi:hypothetical protein TrispH2_004007 [Trichoplax sp. H2]|uniref:Uncharacterized protein n=1 Tax=Trichoplax adhaerens TaxID=10228 RepID=B3RNT8_TRIAD|nr:predicted protein [Trichoplax adhaerens]EDV27521.1 predicted protein [Trichoplax adhaerens]RDD43384.1 hypothetical protein TrispH2_004007 [Trichoplax sp. H2]|eukprot:XP_002109355.1 predicted protein [Trichoplax adhaerens]